METTLNIFLITGAIAGIIGFVISIISLIKVEKKYTNKLENLVNALIINLSPQILTHDSELLLCLLYKKYLNKRELGISKRDANFFKNSEYIFDHIIPKWRFEDVNETCRELERACFINCSYACDDIAYNITLTDYAIIYMENRFKKNLSSLSKHIDHLINVILMFKN